MQESTGKLYVGSDDEIAILEHRLDEELLPLTQHEFNTLSVLPNSKRVEWARHRLAPLPEETVAEYQARKNADKRARRARRG